ncbi:MAG: AAA family ATPase [Planctomycetota bacterium]|nr:AAA family ATPase [Planctomycetota bacterium]
MSDSKKSPKTPEEIQKEIQSFLKEKFGADIFTIPMGAAVGAGQSSEDSREQKPEEDEIPSEILAFNMRPSEVKSYLDRFVIGQDEAKCTLAVAVCDHYNHVQRILRREKEGGKDGDDEEGGSGESYIKQNVILLGPTGVGKTYLVRILAQLIGVPFVKADITKFSETGYVGGDVEDMVRELYRMADGNHQLAEHGIVFLDEIDKISSAASSSGRDPSGRGVQVALLKLMEDTDVPIRNPMDISAQFQDMMQMRHGASRRRTLNTRHILFVVSGAFSSLPEIIEKRLREGNIGFAPASKVAESEEGNPLAKCTTGDFIDYGFEPEFIGRLPIRIALDDLGADELFQILKNSEGSILHQYRQNFRDYGIDVAFEDSALQEIAERAHAEKTGARGLMTVLESCLRDFKFHLPGTSVGSFAVTKELVQHTEKTLRSMLERPEVAAGAYTSAAVREFEVAFEKTLGVRLALNDEAVVMAVGLAAQNGQSLRRFLQSTFRPHADFLRKILEKSKRHELPVTPKILQRPAEGVELWLGKDGAS